MMPDDAAIQRMRAAVEERAKAIARRIEREVKALCICRHQKPADQCTDCRGLTELNVPMDLVLQVLREHGLVEVELDVAIPVKDGHARHQRSLKTLVGLGIGVSFFVGFAWQGGKFIARLVNRGAAPPK